MLGRVLAARHVDGNSELCASGNIEGVRKIKGLPAVRGLIAEDAVADPVPIVVEDCTDVWPIVVRAPVITDALDGPVDSRAQDSADGDGHDIGISEDCRHVVAEDGFRFCGLRTSPE